MIPEFDSNNFADSPSFHEIKIGGVIFHDKQCTSVVWYIHGARLKKKKRNDKRDEEEEEEEEEDEEKKRKQKKRQKGKLRGNVLRMHQRDVGGGGAQQGARAF